MCYIESFLTPYYNLIKNCVWKGDYMAESDTKQTISPVTMRLSEESVEEFKQLTKEMKLSQGELFALLVGGYKTEQLKKSFGNREKEIENFQYLCNEMVSLYINSVQMNDIAERSLKENTEAELSRERKKTDKLRIKVEQLEERLREQSERESQLTIELNHSGVENSKLNERCKEQAELIRQKESYMELLDEKISTQSSDIERLSVQVDGYDALKTQYQETKIMLNEVQGELNALREKCKILKVENDTLSKVKVENDQLKLELVKANGAIEVLQNQNQSLSTNGERLVEELRLYKEDAKSREAEFKDRIHNLEEKNKHLDKKVDEFADQNASVYSYIEQGMLLAAENNKLRDYISKLESEISKTK